MSHQSKSHLFSLCTHWVYVYNIYNYNIYNYTLLYRVYIVRRDTDYLVYFPCRIQLNFRFDPPNYTSVNLKGICASSPRAPNRKSRA